MTLWHRLFLGAASFAFACALLPAASFAQDAPQQMPPGVSDEKTIGSWSVRCYRAPNFPCDLTQASFIRNRNVRIASVSIAYIPAKSAYVGRFVMPLGVAFDKGLAIQVGNFHAQNLRFHRCERDGCYVEGVLPNALIEAMQNGGGAKGAMAAEFIDNRKFQIPIILDGFSDSLDLLKKWATEKGAPAKSDKK